MHTGSSTALFPPNGYKSKEGNVVLPSDKQREIYKTFVRFTAETKLARKGRRLIVVNLGDNVDGFHHGSMQESLFRAEDQSGAHMLLMNDFFKRVGFKKGDEYHCVKGTESHVKDYEDDIAKELGAVKNKHGEYISDTLLLNINGSKHLFAHHGKSKGSGHNEGNALRNFLRAIRQDRRMSGVERIDALWSGHYHAHCWETHKERQPDGNFHEMHGIILPSWQAKTRYAYAVAATDVNTIGGVYCRVSVDGDIFRPRFRIKPTE